ncbi:hypothetical protein ACOTFF_13970 [Achromobacter xylosoxidans]
MYEADWRAIVEKVQLLPEGQQGCLRYGPTTLIVERRGPVFIALRAISASEASACAQHAAWPSHRDSSAPLQQDGQLLRIAQRDYLCSWRRQPTHWDWLIALATTPITTYLTASRPCFP